MAERLARMYGTEEDKVNCPFYVKIGACRHGDRCSRQHNKPLYSQTVVLEHMYVNPMSDVIATGGRLSREQEHEIQERFLDFYEDVFLEVSEYGEVEDLLVADNLGDHLIGNVYIKYHNEEDAQKALGALNGRWYAGRRIAAEYSPVTEFREARCRQFDERGCDRGGYCNFMHLKKVPHDFARELMSTQPHAGENEPVGRGGGGGRDRDDRRGGGGGGDRYGGGGRDRYPPPGGDYRGGGDRDRYGGGGGGYGGGGRDDRYGGGGGGDRDRYGGGGGGGPRYDDRDRYGAPPPRGGPGGGPGGDRYYGGDRDGGRGPPPPYADDRDRRRGSSRSRSRDRGDRGGAPPRGGPGPATGGAGTA